MTKLLTDTRAVFYLFDVCLGCVAAADRAVEFHCLVALQVLLRRPLHLESESEGLGPLYVYSSHKLMMIFIALRENEALEMIEVHLL